MANNPFSPQSNMSFFGGVNDMATMLPGGRSTFNSMGPATAAAPATAGAAGPIPTAAGTPQSGVNYGGALFDTVSQDTNAAAIANAAAALGTGSGSAATGAAASPFAPASNLNFSRTTAAPATGTAVGGGVPNPNAIQGPQYAPSGSGMPGSGWGDAPPLDSPEWPAYHARVVARAQAAHDLTYPNSVNYASSAVSPTGMLTRRDGSTLDLNSTPWSAISSGMYADTGPIENAWLAYHGDHVSNTQLYDSAGNLVTGS